MKYLIALIVLVLVSCSSRPEFSVMEAETGKMHRIGVKMGGYEGYAKGDTVVLETYIANDSYGASRAITGYYLGKLPDNHFRFVNDSTNYSFTYCKAVVLETSN